MIIGMGIYENSPKKLKIIELEPDLEFLVCSPLMWKSYLLFFSLTLSSRNDTTPLHDSPFFSFYPLVLAL